MLALRLPQVPRQVYGDAPQVLGEVLEDGVNLALWQRRLPVQIEDFTTLLLARNQPLAESLTVHLEHADAPVNLPALASGYANLHGHAAFVADVECMSTMCRCG